jgi:hypothetical protein
LSEHLTKNQIVDYGRRPLPPAEWLFVSDHLAVCELCRLQVEETVTNETTFIALKSGIFDEVEARSPVGEGIHLSFEQMASLVDKTIAKGKEQLVKEHLARCEECEAAVDDLRAFKEQVAPEIAWERGQTPSGRVRVSGWQRLMAALGFIQPKSPALVFGTALAILLVAVSWLAWQGLPGMKNKSEVVGTRPLPSVLPGSGAESSEAVIIARINDGEGQITLDKNGKISGVDHLPSGYQRMVQKALSEQKIERSAFLAESTQAGVRWRGEVSGVRGKFSVIEPMGVVILSDQPTFRWTQLDGASGYVVEVYDEWFNLMERSPQISGNSWRAARSFKRGGNYYWQVKGMKEGQEYKAPRPPAGQAKFRILDGARAEELAKARRAYATSHLTLGLLYAQAGLVDEAGEEFQALLKNNPESGLAQRLLREVRKKP